MKGQLVSGVFRSILRNKYLPSSEVFPAALGKSFPGPPTVSRFSTQALLLILGLKIGREEVRNHDTQRRE